jgi:hypothetical protein
VNQPTGYYPIPTARESQATRKQRGKEKQETDGMRRANAKTDVVAPNWPKIAALQYTNAGGSIFFLPQYMYLFYSH